jgi:hypothetical protein
MIAGKLGTIQPELRLRATVLYMNVRWLVILIAEKEDAISPPSRCTVGIEANPTGQRTLIVGDLHPADSLQFPVIGSPGF